MKTSTSLILIFFGALLIYLSLFGPPIVATFQLSSLYDDFNGTSLDTSKWIKFIERDGTISVSNGRLQLQAKQTTGKNRVGVASTSTFNEGKFKARVICHYAGMKSIQFSIAKGDYVNPLDSALIMLQPPYAYCDIRVDGRFLGRTTLYSNVREGDVLDLEIELASGKVYFRVYDQSGNLLGQASSSFDLQGFFLRLDTESTSSSASYGEVDWVETSVAGSQPPPPPPSPGTGKLEVYIYVDGKLAMPDGNKIYVNGEEKILTTTGYWSAEVNPGTYTVQASYKGQIKSDTKTVYAGTTARIVLSWGTEAPPTPAPWNPLEWLYQILANPLTRSFMLTVGIVFVGIGFIGMVAGREHRKPMTT